MIIRKANTKDFKMLKEAKKDFFMQELSGDQLMNPKWMKTAMGSEINRQLKSKNCIFFVAEENLSSFVD